MPEDCHGSLACRKVNVHWMMRYAIAKMRFLCWWPATACPHNTWHSSDQNGALSTPFYIYACILRFVYISIRLSQAKIEKYYIYIFQIRNICIILKIPFNFTIGSPDLRFCHILKLVSGIVTFWKYFYFENNI